MSGSIYDKPEPLPLPDYRVKPIKKADDNLEVMDDIRVCLNCKADGAKVCSCQLDAKDKRITKLEAELAALKAKNEALVVTSETSDGYHTFAELYEYRMLYNAHACAGWIAKGIPVVKSWRHSDGELCFGGGYFIVVAVLPSGQVSNHYKAEHWDLFDVPSVDLPPEYDGHTPQDAAERLYSSINALAKCGEGE